MDVRPVRSAAWHYDLRQRAPGPAVSGVPDESARPRVLLADDDTSIQNAFSRLLSETCDVVGLAQDSATLFDAAARVQPDVVLLDFSLPGGLNALTICKRLTTMLPGVK